MKTRLVSLLVLVFLVSLGVGSANAATLYGNSAIFGANPIHIIDSNTGVESTRYYGNPGGNGRGMVVVGDTMYYTVTDDSKIYKMDLNTGATTGFIQTTNASMSTIAWDGSSFWTSDYSGTNEAYQINANTGVNIKTINLSLASTNMDGMEWFNGKLIANREDAGFVYDIYDLDGNVIQANFINTGTTRTTGIAYDGTDFWVSAIFDHSILRYNGSTGAYIGSISLTASGQDSYFLIEDLSVDYSQRPDTGGPVVPEPTTILLFGLGLLGLTGINRRKR